MDDWREGIDLNEETSTVDILPEARDGLSVGTL